MLLWDGKGIFGSYFLCDCAHINIILTRLTVVLCGGKLGYWEVKQADEQER